jgi:hypothetical protein
MRRAAGANPRRKRTHDHFPVRQATQTDARGQFGRPKCAAPLEMPLPAKDLDKLNNASEKPPLFDAFCWVFDNFHPIVLIFIATYSTKCMVT